MVGVVRVDPNVMMIAVRASADTAEGRAAVGAPEQAAGARGVGSFAARAKSPSLSSEVPHAGVERLRRRRIHRECRAAGGGVSAGENLRPGLSTISALVQSPIVAVTPESAGDANVHRVAFRGVDENL